MIGLKLKAAWAAITGARGLITLLALAAAAAFLWIKWTQVTRERDHALRFAGQACEIVGQPTGGLPCLQTIASLVAFERDALRGSNQVLAAAQRDRETKSAADLTAARRAAERAATATERLEKADAQVSGDHVGADWFGAVNDAAGLRPGH